MKKWIKKFDFSDDPDHSNQITSISMTSEGDQVYAGSKSGRIYLFERRVDGSWDNTLTWTANRSIVDAMRHQKISEEVIDTDIFTIQKKSPLLITAGFREIRIWFISDRYETCAEKSFEPNGIEFPKETSRQRFVAANEISLFQTMYNFSSVRACQDGLSFGYTEENEVSIRRIDRSESNLAVFKNDNPLTRVDFEPNHYDIILTGDENGNCSIVDLRIQPQTTVPTCRINCANFLKDRFYYVNDCRFSPDGTKFFSRHFGSFFIWDIKNLTEPVTKINFPLKGNDNINHLTTNGREYFRSTWVDEKHAATGWIGGEMLLVPVEGEATKVYVTKNSHKKRKKFLFSDKKKSWKKYHSVMSVDIPPGGCRAAASNGGQIFIYDLE